MATHPRDPLVLEIVAWVAAEGRLSEGWRPDPDDPRRLWLQGLASGSTVHINPVPDTLDTVIHEVLHVIRPQWTERGVRRRTSQILKSLTDGEVQTLWAIYQDRLQREHKRRGARRVNPAVARSDDPRRDTGARVATTDADERAGGDRGG